MTEQTQLLKLRDVTRLTTLHHATIYRMIKRDEFPKQIRISRKRVVWRASDVEAWLNRQKS
jgi:prophage regulatory protein